METQRPRRDLVTLALLCALLLSLALAAGCAGGGEAQPSPETNGAAPATNSADSAKTASSISEEEAREVAEKALLTLRDFPAGWSQEPPEEEEEGEDEDVPLPDMSEECRILFEQEGPAGVLVEMGSPKFEGPDKEKVESGATIYVNAEAGRQEFLVARQIMDRCRDPWRELFTQGILQGLLEESQGSALENAELAAVTVDWLSFPPYGDESLAMRINFTLNVGPQALTFYEDMFSWRVDRIEGDMTFFSAFEPPDLEEEQRLAQIIDERLKEAVAELD